jgi:hypothetical protein
MTELAEGHQYVDFFNYCYTNIFGGQLVNPASFIKKNDEKHT